MSTPSLNRPGAAILAAEGLKVAQALETLLQWVPTLRVNSQPLAHGDFPEDDLAPVPLSPLWEALPLYPVPLPGLCPAAAITWLAETFGWDLGQDFPGDRGSVLSGLLVLARGPGGFLFYNTDEPLPRQRFSIAHEVGHFLLHAAEIRLDQTQGILETTQYQNPAWDARERQANRFAAELLLPGDRVIQAFRRDFPDPLPEKTIQACLTRLHHWEHAMASRTLVSAEAVHFRLVGLDLIPFAYRGKRPGAPA